MGIIGFLLETAKAKEPCDQKILLMYLAIALWLQQKGSTFLRSINHKLTPSLKLALDCSDFRFRVPVARLGVMYLLASSGLIPLRITFFGSVDNLFYLEQIPPLNWKFRGIFSHLSKLTEKIGCDVAIIGNNQKRLVM